NVPDEPFTNAGAEDPGYHNLVNSSTWAILDFSKKYATGIKNDFDGNQPVDFQLSQNYPNPFNPTTTIRFSIDQTMPVTLKVYNTLGQNVATLIDGKSYSAGKYRVTWNASTLSSGVYFYKLEAGGKAETRKMLLIK
ncbi:T9SS type A sorting domain-containing protein, partial [candidate division KSB1 bacterium]|nr:T9SS type A sorting domain-containing protein [candidate division KSB1 bacterium]